MLENQASQEALIRQNRGLKVAIVAALVGQAIGFLILLRAEKIAATPVVAAEKDLVCIELPPSMCWVRHKNSRGKWSYGVQRKDGSWLLLPCQFQPYEEIK